MGRKKTYVGTSISRVIEDDRQPNSVKTGLLNALLTNGEIVDNVLESLVGSVAYKAERMYRWAAQGDYVHGLPSGSFKTPSADWMDAVQAVLDTVHGVPVTIDYAYVDFPNLLHMAWSKLLADHGYDPATNLLGNLSTSFGTPVYLFDMVVKIPETYLLNTEPRTFIQWGRSPLAGPTITRPLLSTSVADLVAHMPVEVSQFVLVDTVTVTYEWQNSATKEIHKASFDIPITGYQDESYYVQARYLVGSTVHYWTYLIGSGTHASIDEMFDTSSYEVGGQFFPFIYFRFNKASELDSPTSESYKDNKKLLKYLGMDYDAIAEGVDANPDIADVEQAMLMFAVPANTTNEQEQRYLFDFFNRIFLAQPPESRFRSEAAKDMYAWKNGVPYANPSMVIQDQRFKLDLANNGIYKIRKAGVIGKVGEHTSGFATFMTSADLVGYINIGEGELQAYTYTMDIPVTYHYYRRQISKGVYDEIQVVDMETRFNILGDYATIGDEDDKILLIPLDHSITEDYSAPDREILYARAMHYVFNSAVVVKVKWYQTGLFKFLTIVVAIAITIYTMGADGGSALTAALAAGAVSQAVQILFVALLEALLFRAAFKLFVKVIGVKWAFIIAIVAALAGLYMFMEGGFIGTPWANDLLTMANGLVSGIKDYTQSLIGDLMGEYSAFQSEMEKQLKLLESAQELLEQDHHLNPFIIFGESPEAFYNRTVHSGNIGVVAIDSVSSFVSMKLTLPKLDETLGEELGERGYVG